MAGIAVAGMGGWCFDGLEDVGCWELLLLLLLLIALSSRYDLRAHGTPHPLLLSVYPSRSLRTSTLVWGALPRAVHRQVLYVHTGGGRRCCTLLYD